MRKGNMPHPERDPFPDLALSSRRSLPPLRRAESNGSFASARDAKFWVAAAVATKSSSASSSASSLSDSFVKTALLRESSSLELVVSSSDDEPMGAASPGVHGQSPRQTSFDFGGLFIDVEVDDGGDDDDEGERKDKMTSMKRLVPITSPPPLSVGPARPTILQRHRPRDRLGSSEWRPTATRPSEATTTVVPNPVLASDTLVKPPPTPICEESRVEMKMETEEVYEHQRYQRFLTAWGSKGHLLPTDPQKYVRIVRNVEKPQNKGRRRPSLSKYDDIQAFPSSTFPNISLPDPPSDQAKWEWISPWHLEYPVRASTSTVEERTSEEQMVDHDGWSYATGFNQFTSWRWDAGSTTLNTSQIDDVCLNPTIDSRGHPKQNVRRRKWIRYRRLRMCPCGTEDPLAEEITPSPFDDSFLDSMCGWLHKLGHVRKNWRRRYFVLEKSVLRYYTDESMTRLKGEVLLFHPAARVHYVDIHLAQGRDNTFAIQVGPKYTLLLEADRVSDRENWMYCIEDALLCRDSYLQDPTRTHDVRESVARRRNLSSETILYSTSVNASSSSGINPINMLMLHSKSVLQSTRNNPLMMRLMVECDFFLQSKEFKQQTAAFIQKFKQKYGGAVVAANSAQISKTMSPMATVCGNRRRTSSYEGVKTRERDVSVMHDPRSLSALKNYRFFLERAMTDVMDHLMSMSFSSSTCIVTSPKDSAPKNKRSSLSREDPVNSEEPPPPSDIDWEFVKKAVLYKLERQTFVPLQGIIYSLLEATVDPHDLDRFEWNRRYLSMQPQQFFEIQDSQLSPSDWKSARALLDSMDNYSLPSEKASILLEVAKCVYDTYATEHAVDVQMLAADDFLPIFIFLLSRSSLRNMVVARHLISETMMSCVMIGETGYYATMFEAAVSYVASFFATEQNEDQLSRQIK